VIFRRESESGRGLVGNQSRIHIVSLPCNGSVICIKKKATDFELANSLLPHDLDKAPSRQADVIRV